MCIIISVTFGFMVLDIVTGYLKAAYNNCVRSTNLHKGLLHKFAYVCIIMASAMIQIIEDTVDLTQYGLSINVPLLQAVCLYIILTELVSVLENASEINPNIKSWEHKLFGLSDKDD